MDRDDIYFRAVQTRDPRFDGKFFVGVRTTGIYCRPICPARPKRENVVFFTDALAAERAGFRPCLRCRPQRLPHSALWNGRSASVQRGLRLIAESGLEGGETTLANRLGLSGRHLRRLFREEVGQTPTQIAITARLNFASQLLAETALPITEVAYAAGFRSLRRFNDAILKRFRRSPTALRRRSPFPDREGLTLRLAYREPFDWETTLDYYRRHPTAGLEEISGGVYQRVFRSAGGVGAVRVHADTERRELVVGITVPDCRQLLPIVRNVRQMFDLDSDPLAIARVLSGCPWLAPLVRRFPGLRIARGWDPFEVAIQTVLGQLVSTEQASRLLAQLVEAYGERAISPVTGRPLALFPTASTLARADLAAVGTTGKRKETIREIARRVASGTLVLGSTPDTAELRRQLREIPGVGAWTAEYLCLRGIGDPDSFPASDLVLDRAIRSRPDWDPDDLKPWRGYAAIYLWKAFGAPPKQKRNPDDPGLSKNSKPRR
jgi:AraC family transcriptional regulator of adaptative response / DNA-3-methyladenine glycosylase II